jgi:hypothetical protein
MSAKTKTLFSIEVVTDHDCGNYQIGEIDFRIHCGNLEKYLKDYGYKGRNSIFSTMGFLNAKIQETFSEVGPRMDIGSEVGITPSQQSRE